MNWEATGALAELFGAAAVVGSLIYLARQLKMTRQVEQVSAFQGVFNGFTHHSGQFFCAPGGLALRGLSDRDSLGPEERLLFDQLLANMLNQLEMTSWLIQAGLMSEEDMGTMDWWLEHKVFLYPGAREWLDEYEPTYPPAFVARMRRAAEAATNSDG
jgi:hypothetical protein